MGFSIKLTGSRFDDDKVFNSLTLPTLVGLNCEFILGQSLAASRRNLKSGLDELTEISTPTWNIDSVSYSTNVVNTGLQTTSQIGAQNTLIAVAERGWSTGRLGGGGSFNFEGRGLDGALVFTTGAFAANDTRRAGFVSSTLPTGFLCFIGRGQAGGLGKMSVGVSGALQTSTATALDGTSTSTGAIKLGGDDGVNSNGSFKVAYFAHFSRVLSDTECADVYQSLKAFFAGRGVTVS
jgi:hypothetical protein